MNQFKIRKPSVDEWFLQKQLEKIKNGFHLPMHMDIDMTKLHKHYQDQGLEVPYTVLVLKAAGQVLEECPKFNKVLFHTFYGKRFLELDEIRVNLPVKIVLEGKDVLTVASIKDPHKKTTREIKKIIKESASRGWSQLPLNKLIHKRSPFVAKPILRLILWAMNNFPSFYARNGGGGISFSSFMNIKSKRPSMLMVAKGGTAVTLSAASIKNLEGKHILLLGLSFEHMSEHGFNLVEVVQKIEQVFLAEEPNYFEMMTR